MRTTRRFSRRAHTNALPVYIALFFFFLSIAADTHAETGPPLGFAFLPGWEEAAGRTGGAGGRHVPK